MNHKVTSLLVAVVYSVSFILFVRGAVTGPDPAPLITKILGWALVLGIGFGVYKYYEWARGQ